MQGKEADRVAAEFLTPGEVIQPELPPRMDLKALEELGRKWGVAVDSLVTAAGKLGRSPNRPTAGRTSDSPNCTSSVCRGSPESVDALIS